VNDDDVEHEPTRDPASSDGPGVRDLLSLGGMLVGCIVAGIAIGLFVDARLGSSPAGALVGTALGIVAAGVGFWLRIRAYLTGR
jgi:F0F1-type ATP synthase assembly protein I